LETLNFRADWSAASELMDIAIDVVEKAPNRDFVLASGYWRNNDFFEPFAN